MDGCEACAPAQSHLTSLCAPRLLACRRTAAGRVPLHVLHGDTRPTQPRECSAALLQKDRHRGRYWLATPVPSDGYYRYSGQHRVKRGEYSGGQEITEAISVCGQKTEKLRSLCRAVPGRARCLCSSGAPGPSRCNSKKDAIQIHSRNTANHRCLLGNSP